MSLYSQIIIDGHIIDEGYLYKKGVYNTSWKLRYFVLYDDRSIDYFKDKSYSRQRNKAKGSIHLTQIKRVEMVQYIHNNKINKLNISPLQSLESPTAFGAECELSDTVLNNKLNLKCDRCYSFALISNEREWILSAETNHDLKKWITKFNKLSQGKPIYDGYLNNNKFFVLYQHKVLICYNNDNKIEFDIDLRHILYLKYDKKKQIEIAINGSINNYILSASNKIIANGWYNKIRSLFADKLLLKLYDSAVEHINIVHNRQQLKKKYIAMYKDYIVIFRDKEQLKSIKQMIFFNKTIFRDYMEKEKCILIPLNKNIKIRKASINNGKYAFLISNTDGDRTWYFNVNNKQILKEWMYLFSKFNKITKNKKKRNYCDIQIESSLLP